MSSIPTAGKTLRFEKSIGRIGALAVALGVGVGIGTSLACGVAHADGRGSASSASSDQSGRGSTAGHASDGASTGTSRRSSGHAGRSPAVSASSEGAQESSGRTGDTVDRGRRHSRDADAPKSEGLTPKLQPADNEAGPPAVGRLRAERNQPDEATPSRTETTVNAEADSLAPAVTARSTGSLRSSDRVSGNALSSLLGTGSPGDDPVGSPTDLVLLAGARREFGSGGHLRPVAASARQTSQGPGESSPIADLAAAKTLSALASPHAAANPLESFISAFGKLINTALNSISGALTSALTAINNAVTTVLRAIGLAPSANHAPAVVDDTGLTTAEDTPVSVSTATLLGNDSDIDGDTLSVSGVSAPAHGSAVLNGTTVIYTPSLNYAGADSFTYTVSDGHGGTATGTVAVAVTAVNDAPAAVGNSVTTAEDTPVSVTAATLLGNDSDVDGDLLKVTGVSSAAHGTAVLDGTTVTYTPILNYAGADSFTYTVSDGHGGTATATVAVTVTPVNDAPVTVDNSVSTTEGTPVSVTTGTLLGNDSDVDGDTLSVTGVSQPLHGSAVLNGTTVTYTPAADFNGVDSLTYTVSDGHGGTATGTLAVTVTGVNDSPVAVSNWVSTAEETPVSVTANTLLSNDSDPDGDTLAVTGISQPMHGSAVLNGTTVTYTPDANFSGVDVLTYTVSDGHGGTASAELAVTVTPVNDLPTAVDDSATTAENTPLTINVIDNDSDADGDVLIVSIGETPEHGTAVANHDGTVTYTPGENYTGTDTFSYSISDGTASDTATVTVSVSSDGVHSLDDFIKINGLAVGPDGTQYVAGLVDGQGLKLARVDADGQVTDLGQIFYGTGPLAVGPDGRVYVSRWDGGITVIDPTTGAAETIPVGSGEVWQVAVGDDGKIVYSGYRYDSETGVGTTYLSVLDSHGNEIVAPVILDDEDSLSVTGLALGPDARIYVTTYDFDGSGGLTVFNSDGTVDTSTELIGVIPTGVAVGADGIAYVLNGGRVIAVDSTGPIGTVRSDWGPDESPSRIAVGPDGLLHVAVTDYSSLTSSMSVLDPTDLVDHATGLSGFTGLYGIAVGSGGQKYVLGFNYDENGVIHTKLVSVSADGKSVTPLVDLGPGSGGTDVVIGPDGRLYVTDLANNTVTAYDPANGYASQLIATVPYAAGLAMGNGRIYVSSVIGHVDGTQTGALTILDDDGSVITTVDLDAAALGVSLGPDGRVYVSTASSADGISVAGALLTFSAAGVLQKTVPLPDRWAYNVAVGPDGTAYVADLSGHVVAVSGGTVRDIADAVFPFGLDFGPDGKLYVTSLYDATGTGPTITVINPATNL